MSALTRRAASLRGVAPLIVAVAALAAYPAFAATGYAVFVASLVLVYAIVGLGLSVAYGYAGQFSIGQTGFFAIGAYVATILATHNVDYLVGTFVGAAAAGIVGAGLGFLATRIQGFGLGLVTFGFGVATYTMILQFAPLTGGLEGIGVPELKLAGMPFGGTYPTYYAAVAVFAIFVAVNLVIGRTFLGRSMLAVKTDDSVASVLGIPARAYKVAAFAYSAVTASVAGSLFVVASSYIAAPAVDPAISITFFAIVVIGGARSVLGILGGSALAIASPELLHATREASSVLFGIAMVLVLMFAEDGVAGLVANALTRLSAAFDRRRGPSLSGGASSAPSR